MDRIMNVQLVQLIRCSDNLPCFFARLKYEPSSINPDEFLLLSLDEK